MLQHLYPFRLTNAKRTPGFLGLLRLQNGTAVITAYSYNSDTKITTGIILQADEAERNAIREQLVHCQSYLGHELLLRTILIEVSLRANVEYLWEIKQDVMNIEHSTGQHTWHNYRLREERSLSDVELSRVAHGLRIKVAGVCRRIEVASIWIELLLERLIKDHRGYANNRSMLQWLRNMETQVKMAKIDVELIAKRADNQVGAVSSALLSPLCSIS